MANELAGKVAITGNVLTVDGGMVTGSPVTAGAFQSSVKRPTAA
jgi:hypothetical protein